MHFLVCLQHVEDRNLLVGHLEMYMEQYTDAQDLLLASSKPLAALEVSSSLHIIACEQKLKLSRL